MADKFLTYKGKPLVRKDETLYYGNMADKYVVMLTVKSGKKLDDIEISDKIVVQLMYTDSEIRSRDRIIKKSEKQGLYNAMDVGSVWLERALKNEQ